MNEILYTIASDKNGLLIEAIHADKENSYFCLSCQNELVLKKSGKTEKNSKRPHFAHKNIVSNCNPETVLHYAFKIKLFDFLNTQINTNRHFEITWICENCNAEHKGNLLKKVRDIKLEYNLTAFKPDITLFDENNKVFAVIEIVVTHKPDENTIKFYKENKIILIQINLHSDTDLEKIISKIEKPDKVDFCMTPTCKKCGDYLIKKTLITYKNVCFCGTENLIAYTQLSNSEWYNGIWRFSEKDKEIAKKYGVNIVWKQSEKTKKQYLSNVCKTCNKQIKEQQFDAISIIPFPPVPHDIFISSEDEAYEYLDKCDTKYYFMF